MEYHAACGPCSTISPRSARFNYRSRRRADRVRKANRASQSKPVDSARMRERRSERGRDRREGKKGWGREAYVGQSIKKCTTERPTPCWQEVMMYNTFLNTNFLTLLQLHKGNSL